MIGAEVVTSRVDPISSLDLIWIPFRSGIHRPKPVYPGPKNRTARFLDPSVRGSLKFRQHWFRDRKLITYSYLDSVLFWIFQSKSIGSFRKRVNSGILEGGFSQILYPQRKPEIDRSYTIKKPRWNWRPLNFRDRFGIENSGKLKC